MTEHLDLEDLLVAARAALGGAPEIRDIGLLEAAVARTRASVFWLSRGIPPENRTR